MNKISIINWCFSFWHYSFLSIFICNHELPLVGCPKKRKSNAFEDEVARSDSAEATRRKKV
ncbi:hypothetical protein DIT68_00105 [Brumimicrobium oceani]|uniref:Uncharacterized protein n=1 Tax=Brumimicrobium oceani TaxID=2100725 RepID=A0A2U2XFZ0_9FLAO|nr:hypothetical protein DIT68_00105 [Brumimicrobium oceani]